MHLRAFVCDDWLPSIRPELRVSHPPTEVPHFRIQADESRHEWGEIALQKSNLADAPHIGVPSGSVLAVATRAAVRSAIQIACRPGIPVDVSARQCR
jgi:hypothetical protein